MFNYVDVPKISDNMEGIRGKFVASQKISSIGKQGFSMSIVACPSCKKQKGLIKLKPPIEQDIICRHCGTQFKVHWKNASVMPH